MAQDWNGADAGRLLTVLEQLLALDATELRTTLTRASQLLVEVLGADKVDVLLYEAASDSLVALGTSDTPMGRREHQLGLDCLPLAEGGRTVEVYRTGRPYLIRRVEDATGELQKITDQLGVCSSTVSRRPESAPFQSCAMRAPPWMISVPAATGASL